MTDRLSTKDQEITALLDSVKDYKFGSLKSAFEINSLQYVQPEDFELAGVNQDKVSKINKTLETKPVAILVADKRMGTSSVCKSWIAQDPLGRQFVDLRDYDGGLVDPKLELTKHQLFLDELESREANVSEIKRIIVDGRTLVIRPHLKSVDFYRKSLKDAEISFGEVLFIPFTNTEMQGYLSRRLSVGEDDDFVKLITYLSGGSLFVANNICDEFLPPEPEDGPIMNREKIRSKLRQSHDQIIESFKRREEKVEGLPDDLKQLVPNPRLVELFS